MATFASANRVKILRVAEPASTGDRSRAVVLLRAIDAIGKLVVDRYAIKLRRRLVHLSGPRGCAVQRDIRSAVVGVDHFFRIIGIDPQIVVVSMRYWDALKGLAAVG